MGEGLSHKQSPQSISEQCCCSPHEMWLHRPSTAVPLLCSEHFPPRLSCCAPLPRIKTQAKSKPLGRGQDFLGKSYSIDEAGPLSPVTAGCAQGTKCRVSGEIWQCGLWQLSWSCSCTFLIRPWVGRPGASTLCVSARPLHPAEGRAGPALGAAPAQLPGRKVLVSSGGLPSSSCTSLPLGCRSKR